MEVELKSNWQNAEVELMKNLHGYEFKNLSDEKGYVDYVAEGEGVDRRLLRVVVGPKYYASKAIIRTVKDTLKELEEEYDEAILVAKSFTSSSKQLVNKEEALEMISPEEAFHSTAEVYEAIQNLVASYCTVKCGGLPKKKEDCEGLVDEQYLCTVRRISDDSDFHIRRGWLPMLMNDFSRLRELHK